MLVKLRFSDGMQNEKLNCNTAGLYAVKYS